MAKRKKTKKTVETLTHDDASRKNIPTAELQSVVSEEQRGYVPVSYKRGGQALEDEKAGRNRDLDPQLVWRGKDEQDWSELVVHAPPLYIQEKVHPKVLVDDLMRRTKVREETEAMPLFADLYADFNGLPDDNARTEFYQHDANWTNRMILGDSLQVMASLAEREGLRGQVQCVYLDPPYGIRFNSNFQWSTTSRDVKDGNAAHITREPEQVKAFRDTWRDGIHSYLTYLRDRFTVARDLLHESGSIFVQIGDENVHRVRAVMDEVFGPDNALAEIVFRTTSSFTSSTVSRSFDYLLWYAKGDADPKYRKLYTSKTLADDKGGRFTRLEEANGKRRFMVPAERVDESLAPSGARIYRHDNVYSQGRSAERQPFSFHGIEFDPWAKNSHWKCHHPIGVRRLSCAERLALPTRRSISYVRYHDDFDAQDMANVWLDTQTGAFTDEKMYVVQTNAKVIERCILMATDPGDLVLDPTCGSGTTSYVAEQWGRRWITIDTSRVALALARARVMGARYPFYLLADSPEGREKEAELTRTSQSTNHNPPATTHQTQATPSIRHGFVYQRVPHIMLKDIANNAEIDVIWEKTQPAVEKALADLNAALAGHKKPFTVETGGRQGQKIDFTAPKGKTVKLPSGEEAPANAILEWEVPREKPSDWPQATQPPITAFWQARIARQKEIDASIAAKADFEYLYDKPYEDKSKVRVAGPFTVESLSPHRVLGVDENDEPIDPLKAPPTSHEPQATGEANSFVAMILENLKTAGVQQAHKEDKIDFLTLEGWPGDYICAVGRFEVAGDEWLVAGRKEQANHKTQATKHKPPTQRRAGIFIGPEFGTVSRQDLVYAAREAGDAGFDVLIACAFNYDAHSSEFDKLGSIPVLKARMNADLHMADDLKNTGKGNLFVIFGEPDVEVVCGLWLVARNGRKVANYERVKELSGLGSLEEINRVGGEDLQRLKGLMPKDGRAQALAAIETLTSAGFPLSLTTSHHAQITIRGVDVFHPNTGEVRSDGAEGIACWFIDTDYNGESFFVRHAYFLGASDPYKSLKTTLKAEIDPDAWESLHSDTSRPFPKPEGGRVAVKVINHLGDEVMKVFKVE